MSAQCQPKQVADAFCCFEKALSCCANVPAEVLAENNRLGELHRISDVFDDIMAAVRGEVKATITTAEVSI